MPKVLLIFLTLLVLPVLALAPLHFHADGSHTDCALCQLSQALLTLFVSFVLFIFSGPARRREFFVSAGEQHRSASYVSGRKGRAPPFRS